MVGFGTRCGCRRANFFSQYCALRLSNRFSKVLSKFSSLFYFFRGLRKCIPHQIQLEILICRTVCFISRCLQFRSQPIDIQFMKSHHHCVVR